MESPAISTCGGGPAGGGSGVGSDGALFGGGAVVGGAVVGGVVVGGAVVGGAVVGGVVVGGAVVGGAVVGGAVVATVVLPVPFVTCRVESPDVQPDPAAVMQNRATTTRGRTPSCWSTAGHHTLQEMAARGADLQGPASRGACGDAPDGRSLLTCIEEEETMILPVWLMSMSADEHAAFARRLRHATPWRDIAVMVPWLIDAVPDQYRHLAEAELPAHVRFAYRHGMRHRFERRFGGRSR